MAYRSGRAAAIGGTPVPLGRFASRALGRLKEEIVLGFRPESARLSDPRPGDIAVPGAVKLVERLGAETVTTVALDGGTDVLVRNPGDKPAAVGDRVTLLVDPENLYGFDPNSGDAVAAVDRG
ncbi:MAG: TOBE domain-containing protein [Alphaproteobacteria bacterium]|nr:TOBE domain-containing protein [Alphaproteobacteria bacterium]